MTLSAEVTQVAVSVCASTGCAPHPLITLPLSLNATVPERLPAIALEMVAVKVTGWPQTEGFTLEDSAVVVGIRMSSESVFVLDAPD